EQVDDTRLLDEHSRRLEGIEARVGQRPVGRAHLFDVDTVDLAHLAYEQGHQAFLGELDGQLVDSASAAPLQDVDAHEVAAHRTDAAGHGAEGARPVGQPDPQDVRGHDLNLRTKCEQAVTRLLSLLCGFPEVGDPVDAH